MQEPQKPFVEGTILSGPNTGMRIRVEDDSAGSGGFYVLFWNPGLPNVGGDYWVERYEDVVVGLEQLGWSVRWDVSLSALAPRGSTPT